MAPKEKLKNIILSWIALTLLVLLISFFLLRSSNSLIKEILLAFYFIIPAIYTRNFFRDQKLDLESYTNKKQNNPPDKKIADFKETLQYTIIFFSFQLLFSFILLILSFSGIQIFSVGILTPFHN